MRKKVLILINPISGFGKQKNIENLISDNVDATLLNVDIEYTKHQGHAHQLAKKAIGEYDVIVAVGGDGTVNEVGSALIGSNTALAIIPTGSGNGLARYLKIPLSPDRALQLLNSFHLKNIDTIKVNEFHSLNVAGIGFDAHISHLFAKKKHRGLIAYIRLVAAEFTGYKASGYSLKVDDVKMKVKAFLISFANSSQYGNNFHIAPDAQIDDGLIDVCIVRDFPKIATPALLVSMLRQDYTMGFFDKIVKAKNIVIEHPYNLSGHVDGEPVFLGKRIVVSINPLSLKVVVPLDDS